MSRICFIGFAFLVLAAVPTHAQSISFWSAPEAVGAGLQASQTRARLSDSQHGGILVTLTVSDSTLALVAPDAATPGVPELRVFVPNGSIDAMFVVQALPDTTGSVTIDVEAPGFATNSLAVDVVTPVIALSGVTSSRSVIDPEDPFIVRVGLPNLAGTGLGTAQDARVGGPGFVANVSSSVPAILTLRTSTQSGGSVTVLVPPGSSSSSSSVASGGVAADGLLPGSGEVSVTLDGFGVVDDSARTIEYAAAALDFLGLPESVGAGLRGGLLRARLNGSAHGGITVDIVSADPSKVLLAHGPDDPGSVSLSIFVADGSIDANFYAHGIENVTGAVAVSASASGVVGAVDGVSVVTPNFRLNGIVSTIDTLDPPDAFTVQVGVSSNGTSWNDTQEARAGGPGIDGVAYVIDPTVAQIVGTSATGDSLAFRIEPGDSSTPGSLATGGLGIDGVAAGSTFVTAAIPGFSPTTQGVRQIEVTQPTITWVGTTFDLGSGLQSNELRARLSAPDHGGVTVTLTVDDPTLALIAADEFTVGSASIDVFIADGQIDAEFHMNALETRTGVVTLSASAPGFTPSNEQVTIVDPRIEISTSSLGASATTLDPPDDFRARIGWIAGPNFHVQPLRPGSPGLTITFEVDDPAVGQLQNQTITGASVEVALQAGETTTPPNVASGGVAFRPVGVGTVDVTASAPGFTAGPNAVRTVNVAAPQIFLSGVTSDIGAGLQSNSAYARLEGGAHGGVTVRVESADPGVLLVAPDEFSAGTTYQDIFVPDGETRAYFRLQAIDGTIGTIEVQATCPGFVSVSEPVDVVQAGVEIESLGASAGVSDSDDPFVVRIGVPNSIGSSLNYRLARRAGAPPLEVELSSSNALVGELVTLGGTGSSSILSIASGADQTPTSVASGGVAFRPIGGGSTLVSAAIDGFFQTGDAIREVQVAVDGIALVSVPAQVGSGLVGGPVLARLGEAAHGGTMVTIASADTTRLRVAPDFTTPGSNSIEVFVANGQTDASFFVHGVAGATGNVDVLATASGFTSNDRSTQIVAPALQIVDLPDSVDVNAPDVPFRIRVGIPDADGVGLAQLQTVQPGGLYFAITVAATGEGNGRLEVLGSEGASVVVEIPVGLAETGATIASGGIVFDPVSPGQVDVGASAPGTIPIVQSMRTIHLAGTVVAVDGPPVWRFELAGASPNPFNPSTSISFSLGRSQLVELRVVDVAGRVVRTLVHKTMEAGPHRVAWDGTDQRGAQVASGVYFALLRGEEGGSSRKMVLLK